VLSVLNVTDREFATSIQRLPLCSNEDRYDLGSHIAYKYYLADSHYLDFHLTVYKKDTESTTSPFPKLATDSLTLVTRGVLD
jgi:hypothetical protein